jgi:hypothetical protein
MIKMFSNDFFITIYKSKIYKNSFFTFYNKIKV